MLLINKFTLSPSSFSLNNKRKRSTASIVPLLQRIKKSFFNNSRQQQTSPINKELYPARRSNTVHCCLSEKYQQEDDITSIGTYIALHNYNTPSYINKNCLLSVVDDDQSTLFYNPNETKYYTLRLERSINDKKYTQKPMENWWSSSPPVQRYNTSITAMAC